MNIFTNNKITPESIDYTHWHTVNDNQVDIHQARTEYLENCIDVLSNYMERYPYHTNYPVWSNYFDQVEDELEQRY